MSTCQILWYQWNEAFSDIQELAEVPLEEGWEKVPGWECFQMHRKVAYFQSVNMDVFLIKHAHRLA